MIYKIMQEYNSIDTFTHPEDGFSFVVINDKDRPGHNFKDIFPYVEIDGQIYITRKVTSQQIHIVKKNTRILIYVEEIK